MKSVFEKVIHIVDSNNKTFIYPDDTILNNIPNDLWTVILRYSVKIFGISNNDSTYPGYNIVTTEQINNEKFREIFIAHYNSVGGIIALGNVTNKWLFCKFPATILFDMCTVFNDEPVKKGQIVKLQKLQKCSHEKNNIITNIVSYENWSIAQGANSIWLHTLNNFDTIHITSTKIIHSIYKHIFDSNNNKIITIQDNSLLNLIIDDIWPIIAQYEPHLFGVGNGRDCYPGYSIVTEEQLHSDSFRRLFIEYCKQNDGIFSFDNDDTNHCLYADDYSRIMNESDNIYLGNGVMTKKGYMRTIKIPLRIRYSDDYYYAHNGAKLYVWNNYNFN